MLLEECQDKMGSLPSPNIVVHILIIPRPLSRHESSDNGLCGFIEGDRIVMGWVSNLPRSKDVEQHEKHR